MSKSIAAAELAEIVRNLLTQPESTGELDSHESFESFMTEIARVVCDHCGGEVLAVAAPVAQNWCVQIRGNDCLPSAFGGIWRQYDPNGELFEQQVCSSLGTPVAIAAIDFDRFADHSSQFNPEERRPNEPCHLDDNGGT